MAETGMTFDEEEDEEPKEDEKKGKKGKKAKVEEVDPEELKRRQAVAAKAKDIATYGRTWIWEDYHEEKDEINALWMSGSDGIARINVAVLEDIEDMIILKSFKDAKMSKDSIQKLIDANLQTQRDRARMYQAEEESKIVPDETTQIQKPIDIIEEGKIEDDKRKFMNPLRPHEMIWNFFYDDDTKKPKHVMRPDAAPEKCYIDGRI